MHSHFHKTTYTSRRGSRQTSPRRMASRPQTPPSSASKGYPGQNNQFSGRIHLSSSGQGNSIITEIWKVKDHHKEVINEMEVNYRNQERNEEVRIMRLALETLWIHLLDKSFCLDAAAADVNKILQSVKQLREDWVLMARQYQGFQKKIARRLLGKQVEEVNEEQILEELEGVVNIKDELEQKVQQLKYQGQCDYLKSKNQTPDIYSEAKEELKNSILVQKRRNHKSSASPTRRLSRFSQDLCLSLIQIPMKESMIARQQQTQFATSRKQEQSILRKLICSSSKISRADECQTTKCNNEKDSNQFVDCPGSRDTLLERCAELLGQTRQLLLKIGGLEGKRPAHVGQIRQSARTVECDKGEFYRMVSQILRIVQEIQAVLLKNSEDEYPTIQIAGQIPSVLDNKENRIQFQTDCTALKQQISDVSQLLQGQKTRKHWLKESLRVTPSEMNQLVGQSLALQTKAGSYQESRDPLKKKITIQQKVLETIKRGESDFSSKNSQIFQEKAEQLVGFDKGKLQSLLECFFPQEDNEEDALKQIQKLRKQIESYNDGRSSSSSDSDPTQSPLQHVILALQNLIQHLAPLSEIQRGSILSSLREQVQSLAGSASTYQMDSIRFESEAKSLVVKIYNNFETPIRKQIQEFVIYLYNKKPGDLLYLIEQFIKRIVRIELGEPRRSSVESKRKSQMGSRVATPRKLSQAGMDATAAISEEDSDCS